MLCFENKRFSLYTVYKMIIEWQKCFLTLSFYIYQSMFWIIYKIAMGIINLLFTRNIVFKYTYTSVGEEKTKMDTPSIINVV